MILLDENVPESQRALLLAKRVAARQIGYDVERKGLKDEQIIPLLHTLDRPTFFTLDSDFYNRRLCHLGYCLVHLDVAEEAAAEYVRRFLRHRKSNTRAKRMGWVVRVSATGLASWRIHHERENHLAWQ